MSIKEEIKKELFNLIQEEKHHLKNRRIIVEYCNESSFDIDAEENFIDKLEKFTNSI